jgi:4-hydroxybenzoate polyprenyltransferase
VNALATLRTWGAMVKFSHSVFALPFALSGALLAAARHGFTWPQLGWIVVAMVAARNAAMGFNRLADEAYDGQNPRTADRALPAGRVSRRAVWALTILLAGVFVFAAFRLGPLCGRLAPVALAVIFGYSYSKRYTWSSHFLLGLALAMAPVGGWLAVSGRFSAVAWCLGGAVLAWVAGFDVIYALQDIGFDRREGLRSIPARFGVARSLAIARGLHATALAALAGVGLLGGLHAIYWLGWLAIASLLVHEHRLLRPDDLSRLGTAFFNLNGVIAVVYLVTILAAIGLGPRP